MKIQQTPNLFNTKEKHKVDLKQKSATFQCNKTTTYSNPNFNKYLINFAGATTKLKKQACKSIEEIKKIIQDNPKSNGIIGSLPFEWIQQIPSNDRENTIKSFYFDFGKIISNFRETKDKLECEDKITELMQKSNIIRSDNKITLNKLGSGAFGDAYLINTQDDKQNFVLKIFKEVEFSNHGNQQDIHGNYAEINRMAYINNASKSLQTKPSQRTRFYVGDTNNAYIISEYALPREFKTIYNINLGLENKDIGNISKNKINKLDVDAGGLEVVSKILASNKKARYIYKQFNRIQIKDRVILWDTIYNQAMKESKHNSETMQILAECTNCIGAKDKRINRIKTLLNLNDSEVNQILARNSAPREFQSELYMGLLKNNDPKVNAILANKLGWIANIHIPQAYRTIYNNSDFDTVIQLIKNIHTLPENIQGKWYETFSQIDNYKVKMNLIDQIEKIYPSSRKDCFVASIETSTEATIPYLHTKLEKIMDEHERRECFDLLIEKNCEIISAR